MRRHHDGWPDVPRIMTSRYPKCNYMHECASELCICTCTAYSVSSGENAPLLKRRFRKIRGDERPLDDDCLVGVDAALQASSAGE